jgi:hypothetical protein
MRDADGNRMTTRPHFRRLSLHNEQKRYRRLQGGLSTRFSAKSLDRCGVNLLYFDANPANRCNFTTGFWQPPAQHRFSYALVLRRASKLILTFD